MLYKRPNSKNYYVKVQHKGQVYRQSTGSANKRDALKYEQELRRRLSALTKQSGFTFSDAAIRWISERGHKKSISTDLMILDYFRPHLENTYLSELTRDRIESLRLMILEKHSTATVNRYMALIRAILRVARDDWQWIEQIPKVPMYPRSERSPRFLTMQEWMTLQASLPKHLSAPAWFAVSTGLRSTAIRSLQWSWIDRDGVRFPPEVMKSGKWLTIPLSLTACYVLAQQSSNRQASGVVFVNHAGEAWAGKFTTRAWKRAAEKAGLDGVTFHDLRHTWASWKLQEGVPEAVVMELGDWRSRELFRRTYGHFSTESLKRLAGYV